jgi:alpha-galactosidase
MSLQFSKLWKSLCLATMLPVIFEANNANAAVTPRPDESRQRDAWFMERFLREKPQSPFSFIYGGEKSVGLLTSWPTKTTTKKLDDLRTQHSFVWTDAKTGLEVRCVAIEYSDFPVVEWTLYFKNAGQKDTPILENIQALDLSLQRGKADAEFVLRHNQGSMTTSQDFQPFTTPLPPGRAQPIGTTGGRPMNANMPYFNLQWGRQGLIIVVSWVGQWASSFNRDADRSLHIVAGQEKTHFTLHPGEEVRTPLIALQFYQGRDRVRSQNIWRRWMIAHNLPRPGGKPFPPIISASSLSYYDGAGDEIAMIKRCAARGLKFDYWWRDAGWYPCSSNWWNVGTWVAEPARYPKGLREVADAAHAQGMKFTVWFEPERAVPGSWLYQNHPEWLFGPPDGSAKLIDLGNPLAFKWLVETIDKLIVEHHIDMYRQDYNFDPIGHWRYNEPSDRQGITEIRQVVGLLAFWDELKRRHPDMPFDNCASGGQRNCLEMMRRGVPLSKSDEAGGTIGSQCQLHGLAPWLPYFGAGCPLSASRYRQRSNMAPWVGTAEDMRKDTLDYDDMRRFIAEWRRVIPYYWGDFYPLTPYSLEENVWMAWQYDKPETGEGVVQAFRRDKCQEASRSFRLSGLDPAATYRVTNLDAEASAEISGKDLTEKGLTVEIKSKPGAAIITYRQNKLCFLASVPGP